MSKVKHARPPSPGDRHSKKHISQDLLFLQAVSNAHNTANKGTVMLHGCETPQYSSLVSKPTPVRIGFRSRVILEAIYVLDEVWG